MTQLRMNYTGFATRDGGNIHVIDGTAPGPVWAGQYSVGFGPLSMSPYANTTVVVDNFQYETVSAKWLNILSASGLGAVGALVGSPDGDLSPPDVSDEQRQTLNDGPGTSVSRRAFLVGSGLAFVTLSAGVGSAESTTDKEFNVASFDLKKSNQGVNLGVSDVVAGYLPPDHTYHVHVDGMEVGTFTPEESLTMNPGATGKVSVMSSDALSFIQTIISRIKSEETITFEFSPVDEPFSAKTVDSEVPISAQPIITDPITANDPTETTIRIGGKRIPHHSADDSAIGSWEVKHDRVLVYKVGEQAPDSTRVTININVGRVEEFRNKYDI